MRVAIAGSSGFVGSALVSYLDKCGVETVRLVRRRPFDGQHNEKTATLSGITTKEAYWDPDEDLIDLDALDNIGIDAIVNLAGENVHQRWTHESKKRMVESRQRSTNLLAKTILKLKRRPEVFISASGISYYHRLETRLENASRDGKNFSEVFDESGPPGSGFLSELCQQWEKASIIDNNTNPGDTRIINLRIGIVLSPSGGVLAKLLPLFKLGLGGKWGSGEQYMSWISIDDIVRIIYYLLSNDSIKGPINAVTPFPATNLEFAKTLGKVLSRPTILTVPAWLAKVVFGVEWAESTLLADLRISPSILMNKGFKFQYPELELYLRNIVGSIPRS